MKKALKILSVALLTLVLCIVLFACYRYYRIITFKDTHDLQQQIALRCNKYITDKNCVGLAVGVIQGDKLYMEGFGYAARNGRPIDTTTIFEIGSITKVFTAELTQILADKGVIKWNETIYDILPPDSKPLTNDNTTLLSLATHTSGFPKTPHLLLEGLKKECDGYHYMNREVYASCIKNLSDKKNPDPKNFNYSNMGYAVLANCLESKAGLPYDSLLQREILAKLGMNNTTFNTDAANFATGYDHMGNETCHWNLPAFYAGCGALRSDIRDMLKFLQANVNDNPLFKSFSETQKTVYKTSAVSSFGKGWEIRTALLPGSDSVIWHNGGTGGFKSFIGFVPGKKTGVVILSNQFNDKLDMLGFDLVTLTSKISMK